MNKALEYRVMPTVALRGLVVFPGMGVTFDVGRTRSLQAIKAAMADDQKIFLVAQKDVRDDEPDIDRLFKIGTVAKISHILRLPNSDTVRVSVDGISRASLVDMLQSEPYLITDVKIRREPAIRPDDKDYATALVRQTKDYFEDYAEVVPQMPAEIILDVLEKNDPGELADYIGSNIMLEYKKRQQILNEIIPLKRLEKVYDKEHEFQLSGLVKCPLCGRGMVGNINRKRKPDGSLYKTYYSYYCNNRKARTGYRCEFHRQPGEAVVNEAVKEIVVSLVSNPKFTERMKEKVRSKVDTSEVDADINRLEQNLKSLEIRKNRLMSEIDNLEINEIYE